MLQGERAESRENRTLGKFSLDGILPAPRGTPEVEVSFDIDANGILSVHARDVATGRDQTITVTASSGLSEAEIRKMVREAAEHVAGDRERRAQVERRNKLDTLCYSAERTIRESHEKDPAADLAALERLIDEGKKAVESQDDARITAASALLETEAQRVAAAMYEKASKAGAPKNGNGGPRKPTKPDVIDAELEDDQPVP